MTPREEELLDVLKKHAEDGIVRGNAKEVNAWIGPHAMNWDIHEMLISLAKQGYFMNPKTFIDGLENMHIHLKS